jgi:hypothetical protein
MPKQQRQILFNDYRLQTTTTKTSSVLSRSKTKTHKLKRFNTRLTAMLILVNVTFCLFSMPVVILQIIYPLFEKQFERELNSSNDSFSIKNFPFINNGESYIDAKMDRIKAVFELLQYLNHSTNFLLYSFSGKRFRNETKKFLIHYFNKLVSCILFILEFCCCCFSQKPKLTSSRSIFRKNEFCMVALEMRKN